MTPERETILIAAMAREGFFVRPLSDGRYEVSYSDSPGKSYVEEDGFITHPGIWTAEELEKAAGKPPRLDA